MAVDASAVLAILLGEGDAERYEDRLSASGASVISTVNYWETLVRMRAVLGEPGVAAIGQLFERLNVSIAPVDSHLAERASLAFERFRGRAGGRLNLGDCFAYALAERQGDGLLFKGNDFPKSDVKSALD